MLVMYSYMVRKDNSSGYMEFGEYQCDYEDFKKFCHSRLNWRVNFRKPRVEAVVARFQDGRVYIWQRPPYYIYGRLNKEGRYGGWQQVK